jgi:hypothetical protein
MNPAYQSNPFACGLSFLRQDPEISDVSPKEENVGFWNDNESLFVLAHSLPQVAVASD